jgi:conjugative transfer signal peptidase TraF
MSPGASDALPTPVARACPAWRTRSGLVLGGLVLAAVLSTRWVRLNVSPSVPLGLYRLAPVRAPLARGTLVVLPVPARVQAWHSAWLPLLKPVAGVAGDVVCVWGETLWIWGPTAREGPTGYGAVWREAQGQALPRLDGCLLVQDGTVFVASPAPNSLDSRYFAAVPIAGLTAQALPLITWR